MFLKLSKLVIYIAGVFLCCFTTVSNAEEEPAFGHLTFIGQYGSVVQFEADFKFKQQKDHIIHSYGRGGLQTTTISPDRSRIFIGTQGKDSPLEVLEMPSLEVLEQPDLKFPELKYPFLYSYWPVDLIAVNNHQIYIGDESFSVQEPPFGTVLVDLEKGTVEKTNNSIHQQSHCDISPDGKYFISDSGYKIQFIDLATDKALWTIAHGEGYEIEAYRRIHDRKVDWESNTMEVIWARYLKGNERIFEHVTIDLKTQKMTIVTTKEPWISQHYHKETFLGYFLKAYAQHGKALMDEPLRAVKAKLTPEIIELLPEKPAHVYISPKGEYLLVNGYTFNDGEKFHTGEPLAKVLI